MILETMTTTERSPYERGLALGREHAARFAETAELYATLFAAHGIPAETVREVTASCTAALGQWRPAYVDELRGVADGAGIAAEDVFAVNARTEVLASAQRAAAECSTMVVVPADRAPVTLQTWDWHEHLVPHGLASRSVSDTGLEVKMFTEFGTLGKIGVNSAGLGVHFNILQHETDTGREGVPVHAVARAILDEATDLDEAEAIVRSASYAASTSFTVVTARGERRAASIEASPAGVAVVEPDAAGRLLHTNHFLDPALHAGDTIPAAAESEERLAHLEAAGSALGADDTAERAAAFCGAAGDAAIVCMHTDPSAPPTDQWATLLTVGIDTEGFALDLSPTTPATASFTRF